MGPRFDTAPRISMPLGQKISMHSHHPKKKQKKVGWGLSTLSHLANWTSMTACKRRSPVRFRPAHFDATGQNLYALSTTNKKGGVGAVDSLPSSEQDKHDSLQAPH